MNPEPSPGKPATHPTPVARRSRPAAWILTWFLYAGLVLGLRVVCQRWEWNETLIVPLAGELLLLPSPWSGKPAWKMILGRAAGLSAGNWLFFQTYVVRVVYQGAEPWSEEVPWAWVIAGAQLVVASLFYGAARLVRREGPD